MTDRELMQQALEALEAAEHLYHHVGLVVRRREIEGVIAALRERLAQPEQEPVAWVERDGDLVWNNRDAAIGRNLYTAPQRREWAGLTEEEINEVLGGDIRDEPSGMLEFVHAIEVKLKEKNHV